MKERIIDGINLFSLLDTEPDHYSPEEWKQITVELLDLLKVRDREVLDALKRAEFAEIQLERMKRSRLN